PGADTNETEEPISLAELFGLGTEQSTEASPEVNATEPMEKTADFIERAELALLDKNYRGAQLFLREAIKENPDDATAWFLRSRTHMLANEIEESEMTATEAVRLAPDDLEIRLHYLEAARPVLSPRRFLGELDEAHEQFPRSLDVLWQLAQQYHIVETNRNAAAILYRRFLEMAPAGHPMRARVQSELTMLNSP
ncbi:MAG: tetratricopeptide repeat protein, partial [Opitutales bacterium]